jgi:hypothetical protein
MTIRRAGILPALMTLFAASASAQGVTGTWHGPVTDPGGNSQTLTFVLKAAGNAVSGTVTVNGDPQPIVDGRLKGDSLSFALVRIRGGGDTMRISFAATVAGDRMQGSATMADGPTLPFTLTRVPAGAAGVASQVAAAAPNDTGPPNPKGSDPTPVDAQRAILAAFDTYDVVAGLGVTNKDTDDLILALIRNPAFAAKVNDIAVECSNSLYQPILDRYIAGEDVPIAAVRPVWRNTTQPSCGFSAFYEELFPLVRRINQTLPPERRLRMLACDPPIDWSKITKPDDARPFSDRDQSIAAVMEREVLAKHRKALMLYGIGHVRHGTRTAVGRYEARYPHVTLIVVDYHGFGEGTPLARFNDALEKRMTSWPVSSLVPMQGSWLADLPCTYFDGDLPGSNCRGYPGVDALLYVGPRDLMLYEPIPAGIALDTAYMSEIRRRAAVTGNPNGPWNPDKKLEQEALWSVFLYNPPTNKPPGQ